MDINTVIAVCESLMNDATLRQEERVADRTEALDYIAYADEILAARAHRYRAQEDYDELRRALKALAQDLRQVNRAFSQRLRREIRAGILQGEAIRARLDTFTTYRPGRLNHRHLGFDTLDNVINGLLLADPVPDPTATMTPEMVSYQATPGSVILELVDRVPLGPDVHFFDIGSGLGKVPLLVHLLTGAPTVGVEIDTALCAYARAQARWLGLDLGESVRFVNADAREVSYTTGEVFYLFTPFTGSMLQAVLTKLARRAEQAPIWVCTHGPCTPTVARSSWLENVDGNADDPFKLALFRSR